MKLTRFYLAHLGVPFVLLLAGFPAPAQETAADLIEAANRVGLGGSPYHEALVLKNIRQIHQLKAEGRIDDKPYQRLMLWHQMENLSLARQAAAQLGLVVLPQAVDPSKGEYRTGSDSDYLVRRRDGRPLTLEDIQAMERVYRVRINQEVVGRSRAAGRPVAPAAVKFDTVTDFMADVRGTTEMEFNRIAKHFQARGADTYSRYGAAIVEAQMRGPNAHVDLRGGGMYVNEMIDQAGRKQAKIDALTAKLAAATGDEAKSLQAELNNLTEERNKYIGRINEVNARMAALNGVRPPPAIGPDSDWAAAGRAQYARTLARIANASAPDSDMRRYSRFILALQIYDLPEAQRAAALRDADPVVRKQVEEQARQFREQEQTRLSGDHVARLRGFLSQTEGGRKLLASYEWVFTELTKERSQRGHVTQILGDIMGDLSAIDQHVGNRAMQLSMWLDIMRQVRDSKSDAEMAINLGRTLASKTYYGMITSYAFTGLVEGDATALAKSLIILLCPKAALPQVVQSIGETTIDLTVGVLFDHQLAALYAAGDFDPKTGALLGIAEYRGGNAACQFLTDALGPDGRSHVEGVFERALALAKEKNLGVEVLSGLSTFGSAALTKALRSTVYSGTPYVLKGDGRVAAACAEVGHYNTALNDFVTAMGHPGSVPFEEGPDWSHPNLDAPAQAAFKNLMTLRAAAWPKVQKALCDGIRDSLETRYRALAQLNEGDRSLLDMLARVERLFRELDMYETGMAWLEYDASFNFVNRHLLVSEREQRIKRMEVLQKYHDAYASVVQVRQTVEGAYAGYGGKRLLPRVLTGNLVKTGALEEQMVEAVAAARKSFRVRPESLPMTGDPDFDRNRATLFLQEAMKELSSDEEHMLWVKRDSLNDNAAKLDADFDKRILGGLCSANFLIQHYDAIVKGASHAEGRLYKVQVFAKEEFRGVRMAAYGDISLQRGRRNRLLEEFREYYKKIQPALVVLAPPAVVQGRGVSGAEYAFRVTATHVPEEATLTWFEDTKEIGTGPLLMHTFAKPGKVTVTVVAKWVKSERVKRPGELRASVSCEIGAPGSDEARRPALAIVLPSDLGRGDGVAGKAYPFELTAKNIPDEAACTWFRGNQPVGTGRKVSLSFAETGTVHIAACAAWEVKGSAGAEEAWARASFLLKAGGPVADRTLSINGPAEIGVGGRVALSAVLQPPDPAAEKRLQWREEKGGKSLGQGPMVAYEAATEGEIALVCELPPASDKEKALSARHTIRVIGADKPVVQLAVSGPSSGETGARLTFSAEVKAPDAASREHAKNARVEWLVQGRPVAAGESLTHSFAAPGTYEVRAVLVARNGEKQDILAVARQTIRIQDKKPGKPEEPGETNPEVVGNDGDKPGGTQGAGTGKPPNSGLGNPPVTLVTTGAWVLVSSEPWSETSRPELPIDTNVYTLTGNTATFSGQKYGTLDKDGWVTFSGRGSWVDPPQRIPEDGTVVVTGSVEAAGKVTQPSKPYLLNHLLYGASAFSNIRIEDEWRNGVGGDQVSAGVNLAQGGGMASRTASLKFKFSQLPYVMKNGSIRTDFKQFNVIIQAPSGWGGKKYMYEYREDAVIPAGGGVTNTVPFEIVARPDKSELLPGERTRIQAVVSGGKPPYTFAWTGDGEFSVREGESIEVGATKPGALRVTVSATDALGIRVSADVDLVVEPFSLKITRQPPGDAKVFLGSKVSFRAELKAGGKVLTEGYVLRWQPHPEALFTPYESLKDSTVAIFTRPGPVEVWAQALRNNGGSLETVAESEGVSVVVEPPEIRLAAQPATPHVGQEVILTATEHPAVDDKHIDYRWVISGTALNAGPVPRQLRQYSLVPRDPGLLSVTARAVARDGGDTLGEVSCDIRARLYEVSISEPRRLGPPPRVWDPAVGGLVEVPREIGTFQDFVVEANIKPAPPEPGALRYEWTVSPEGCRPFSPGSRETRCNAGEAGAYTLAVKIRNAAGVELGAGTRQVSIIETTSEAEARAKKEEAARKEREERALALIRAGEAHERRREWKDALAKYRAALELGRNPKAEARVTQIEKMLADAERAKKLVAEGEALERAGKLSDAVEKYEAAHALTQEAALGVRIGVLRKTIAELERAEKLVAEGEALEQAGRLAEALARYETAYAITKAPGLAVRIGEVREKVAQAERAARLVSEGEALERAGRLPEALAKVEAAYALTRDPALATRIGELKKKIANAEKAAKLVSEGQALEKAGRLADAVAKYEAAHALTRDPALATRIGELRKKIADAEKAARLVSEGQALEGGGKFAEALAKYEAAHAITKDPALAGKIAELKKKLADIAKAQKMRAEAEALEQAGKLPEALAKYEALHAFTQSKYSAGKIAELKKKLADIAKAKSLREEAQALEQAGKLREALAKFEELHAFTQSPYSAGKIAELKKKLADEARQKPKPAPAPALKSLTGSFVAEIVDEGEKAVLRLDLRQSGTAVTGTYTVTASGVQGMKESVQGTIRGNRLVLGEGEMTISPDYNQIIMEAEGMRAVFKRVN